MIVFVVRKSLYPYTGSSTSTCTIGWLNHYETRYVHKEVVEKDDHRRGQMTFIRDLGMYSVPYENSTTVGRFFILKNNQVFMGLRSVLDSYLRF